MPMWILEGMSTHLAKLRAEGALRRVTEIQLGTGHMTKTSADSVLRAWRADAGMRPRLSSVAEIASIAGGPFQVVRDIPKVS